MKLGGRIASIVLWLFIVAVALFEMTKEGVHPLKVATVFFASLAIVLTLIAWGRERSRGIH